MKRGIGKIIVLLCLAGMLVSCETLDNILALIGVGNNEKETTSSSVAKPVAPKGYTLPESYKVAESYRTDKPYDFVKKIPKNVDALRATNPSDYVKEVCAIINENAQNDFEKAKMAHDVVAVLVSYDAASFWAGAETDQSWENVLKTKLAVCEGYSNLYKRFCDALSLKCEKVTGYARGVGYDISQAENPSNSNHAWNIVQLDGAWYLVDTTWGSGYMNGKKSVQAYNTDWLFTRPVIFLYSHYPTKKSHQLIDNPLSAEEFKKLPPLRPKYFDVAKNPVYKIGLRNYSDNNFIQEYDDNDEYVLNFVIRNSAGKEIKNCVMQETNEGRVKTTINFPLAGRYKISMFLFKKGKNSGTGVGDFFVETTSNNDVLFPEIFGNDGTMSLVSPKTMPLTKGETYTFKVYAPTKNFVAIINGRTFTQMEKDEEGYFSLDYEIPATVKTLNIGSSKSERGSYATFATFSVK